MGGPSPAHHAPTGLAMACVCTPSQAAQVASASRAKALALMLRSQRGFAMPGIPVCLGRLESTDFAPLARQRKEAVQAFWTEYLSDKTRVPEVHFDGTGMLSGNVGCFGQSTHPATN